MNQKPDLKNPGSGSDVHAFPRSAPNDPSAPHVLSSRGAQSRTPSSAGVDGRAGGSNLFGRALAAGDLDAGRFTDFGVGALADSIAAADSTGSVTLLHANTNGLTTAGVGGTRYRPTTPRIVGVPEALDFAGSAIAAAPIRSATQDNLVVGPRRE